MEMLNQIILEGWVSIEMPKLESSDRLFIENKGMEIEILVPGDNLQKYVRVYGNKDRGVRLVGKLITKDNRLMVMAEHIEFRLEYKKVVENA